jgi:hypothetical protein
MQYSARIINRLFREHNRQTDELLLLLQMADFDGPVDVDQLKSKRDGLVQAMFTAAEQLKNVDF